MSVNGIRFPGTNSFSDTFQYKIHIEWQFHLLRAWLEIDIVSFLSLTFFRLNKAYIVYNHYEQVQSHVKSWNNFFNYSQNILFFQSTFWENIIDYQNFHDAFQKNLKDKPLELDS